MRSHLDHLPDKQQAELARVRTILFEEFDRALNRGGGGTQPWRRNGRILKLILFGSYARSDWVDEPQNGYQSDFDLLVVVNSTKLTDVADYWYVAEDRILHDPSIERTVNIIVHDLADVNAAARRGEYFWADLLRDGISLYELPGYPIASPSLPSPKTALAAAEAHRRRWDDRIDEAIEGASFYLSRRNLSDAAFLLHQAVERAYVCALLVHTNYAPRSHNIKFLRSLAEGLDPALIDAWPRLHRDERRRFELLKRAYVDARYSDQFEISNDDLVWLMDAAQRLQVAVATSSEGRIARLRALAEAAEGD